MATTRVETLGLTEIRDDIRSNYNEARRGVPVGARRAHDAGGVVWIDMDRTLDLLKEHVFTPEVYSSSPAQVGIWLPQFGIYGVGADLDAAEEDLLSEVRLYVEEYLGDLDAFQSDPVRRDHYWHVFRAAVAHMAGRLRPVIFDETSTLAAD